MASVKAAGRTIKNDIKTNSGPIAESAMVRWWDNGLRHGVALEVGRKWVRILYAGRVIRKKLSEVESAE